MRLRGTWMAIAIVMAATAHAAAQDTPPDAVTIELRDGSRLVGRIIEEDADHVRLRTAGGLEVDVPAADIVARRASSSTSRRRSL